VIREFGFEDLEAARAIFREYAELVGRAICFQAFERELDGLPGSYAPPEGRLLLAFVEDQLAGCVALRRLEPGICEMKRLYVRPAFQGTGLGRRLVDRVMEEARDAGYGVLRLDTLPSLQRAISMYLGLGFYEIPRYSDNPDGAICFELKLAAVARMPSA
jgi:ribosomal protein S18 acetylase RimI-like enzyme